MSIYTSVTAIPSVRELSLAFEERTEQMTPLWMRVRSHRASRTWDKELVLATIVSTYGKVVRRRKKSQELVLWSETAHHARTKDRRIVKEAWQLIKADIKSWLEMRAKKRRWWRTGFTTEIALRNSQIDIVCFEKSTTKIEGEQDNDSTFTA